MTTDNSSTTNDAVRTNILEIARDLFAKFGYKKTTMDDIAQAQGKGKSSLYYYFKNKEEIFEAVIESEGDILFGKLKSIVDSKLAPEAKMRKYVEVRMETLRELDNYNKALNDESHTSFIFLEKIKSKSEAKEIDFLNQILNEGVTADVFQVKNSKLAAITISVALKGLENPLLRSSDIKSLEAFRVQLKNILNILFYGLMKR